MSIHPSLNFSDKEKKQRSVLKRIERLKYMIEKEEWKDVYIKIKKNAALKKAQR